MPSALHLDLVRAQKLINSRFVKADPVFHVLANGFVAAEDERPGYTMLWGPPGYGKSEITETFFEGMGVQDEVFTLSFGEDTDEAKLLGGLDLKKFDEEKLLEYLLENSFAEKKYFHCEEFFDASGVVLCCLKDIFSSRRIRKGRQNVPIKTRFVVACTNMNPSEFGEGDDARAALVQRFPLQQEVRWQTHGASDYLELYRRCYPKNQTLHEVMANITAEVNERCEGRRNLSPREARDGMDAMIRQARIFDRTSPIQADFNVLEWVGGYKSLPAEQRKQVTKKNFDQFGGHIAFHELQDRFARAKALFEKSPGSMEDIVVLGSEAGKIKKAVLALTVGSDLFEQKQGFLRDLVASGADKEDR